MLYWPTMHHAVDDSLNLAGHITKTSRLPPFCYRCACAVPSADLCFARNADDFADEGDLLPNNASPCWTVIAGSLTASAAAHHHKSRYLQRWPASSRNTRCRCNCFTTCSTPSARNVVKTRYENLDEVMDYCRRSANPIGRLLLHLYGRRMNAIWPVPMPFARRCKS